ncbi:MAG TPA: carbohydrate kinase [Acidimicrobiales bacterium]|nr:carbohydrate kinase [Acidimicrobiales bacterium]
MTAPFVVVGEALVDVVVPPDGETTHAPGGSPMNVAVGLSRLGVPALLVTELGDDAHGELVAEHLRASDVALAPGSVRGGHRTSTATARLAADGAASYEFDLTWELASASLPDELAGLHVGSLGTALAPGRESVLALLAEAAGRDVLVTYDPNVRAGLLPSWHDVARVAADVDVVKMSDEDLDHLRPEESLQAVAREVLDNGRTRLVVVTRGGSGAVGFTAQGSAEVRAPRTEVVDTVGAGDSFMAALIAVLLGWGDPHELAPDRLRTLLESAAHAAAVTVSRRGANPPRRAELPAGWGEG